MSDKLEYPQLHQQLGIHRPTGVRLEMREIGDFRTYDVIVLNGEEEPFTLTLFVSPKDYAAFDRVWNTRKDLIWEEAIDRAEAQYEQAADEG